VPLSKKNQFFSDANLWRMKLPRRDRAIADAWIGVFSAAM
jgi:hypothetical protein